MKIIVNSTSKTSAGARTAVVTAAAGTAVFALAGSHPDLVAGRSYSAELTANEALSREANVWPAHEMTYRMSSENGLTTLVGTIESVDPDGVLYFRLGDDSLTMLEANAGDFVAGEWVRIAMPYAAIEMRVS